MKRRRGFLAGECHKDAEIAARCRLLLAPWWHRHAPAILETMRPPGWDTWPWIDWGAIKVVDYWTGQYYLEQARSRPLPKLEYAEWSEATRLMLVDRLATRQDVGITLERLCEAHRAWCADHGRPVPPEFKWR